RKVAVGDRSAERPRGGAHGIDVDPLMVVGGVGEEVDLVLRDLPIPGEPQVRAGQGGQLVEGDRGDLVHDVDDTPSSAVASPSRRTALSLRIFGRTSSLMSRLSKSRRHRSGVSSGKSDPKSTLSCSSEFACCTSCGGKYFGDQPDRSM